MGDEYTTSPGQLRQFEENNGWLPSQSATETTETNTSGATEAHPPQQEVKPMTMGRYAQNVSFNKGDYFSHDNKVYYKAPDGKVSLVTGDAMGDVELDAGQTAQLEKERAEKAAREKAEKEGPIYTDQVPDGVINPNDPRYQAPEISSDKKRADTPFNRLSPDTRKNIIQGGVTWGVGMALPPTWWGGGTAAGAGIWAADQYSEADKNLPELEPKDK